MPVMEELEEPREYERFQVCYGAVATLECAFRVKVGLITDISMGGLSFRYLDHKIGNREEPKWPSYELEISWRTKKGYCMDRVPCGIVSDLPMPAKESYSYVPMRKCSVRFGKIPPEQITQLEYFIVNFTKGPICEVPNISLRKELEIDEKTRKGSFKCHRNFACLTNKGQTCCKIEEGRSGRVLFAKSLNKELCSYKMFLGSSLACNCPTRKEIYKKYNF